jgi:hypothetical protein
MFQLGYSNFETRALLVQLRKLPAKDFDLLVWPGTIH